MPRSNGKFSNKKGGQTMVRKRKQQPSESEPLDQTEVSPTADNARKKVRWGSPEEGSGEDEEESEDATMSTSTDKVCMAISCQFGRIGCAFYDPIKCTVYVLADTHENKHFDVTKSVLEQASPDVVLSSSKADDNCMDILRDQMDASGGTFQVRPHKDFSPAKGRDRILSLKLLSELPAEQLEHSSSDIDSMSEARSAYNFMRQRRDVIGDPTAQRWNASVRLANYASIDTAPLCLGSVGALLDHLARTRAIADLEDEGIEGLGIRSIEALPLSQSMQINTDALFSLQIFSEENHASIHSDKTKEGLSLFGILNSTKMTLGRLLMREWLLRPSTSLEVIQARHDAVACFLRPENLATSGVMHAQLKGVKNIPKILGVMKAGKGKVSDWQVLVKFTFHALMLRDALTELNHTSGVPILKKLLDALDSACFREIGTLINETIDWEESTNAGRVCVRPHVDEELDNLKHIYHGIDEVLSRVAQQISTTVPPDYATSLNVVYFPQLGFLICIPMLDEWKGDEGITILEGWIFQFSSESHVYFKSQEMQDMDHHIGDLHPSIVDREIEIIQALLEKILLYEEALCHACDICAEIDCLLSFAEASRAYNYRRPEMTNENVLDIKQGRHPLQELVVDTFVPNDAFAIGGAGIGSEIEHHTNRGSLYEQEYNGIIVCTGANACGKSVYLKQVGLIQYMAQIGCFVPAESAVLGIVDKIFTRIQTRESVSKVQSAFMIDLNQVSLALRNSTARSLILLDELGKGTVSSDGAGLFCGVLKHLAGRGTESPKVFAATHFHDIFNSDILEPRSLPITFVHMQVLLTTTQGNVLGMSAGDTETSARSGLEEHEEQETICPTRPSDKITYLYRVAKGLSFNSHAAVCAEIFGIPQRVARRAQFVSRLLSSHELGRLLDEEMTNVERKELEEAEEVCKNFLAWDLDDYCVENRARSVKEVLTEVVRP
ncbi:hypothetical protein CERSUDRAFT_111843 [Gelatoporia subvermispora B]|uniref:DNA mismatch repair proteins mutS family domain-containing protein n=1 Tax=Ceriporiopsis subvermispora (strain B) TaxID=914234 RepID=M2PS99_CERS8|nr:hypothetical protein CERSUDRAFT_111843 [Gelatoporia subvermispora B]